MLNNIKQALELLLYECGLIYECAILTWVLANVAVATSKSSPSRAGKTGTR